MKILTLIETGVSVMFPFLLTGNFDVGWNMLFFYVPLLIVAERISMSTEKRLFEQDFLFSNCENFEVNWSQFFPGSIPMKSF